MSGHLKAGHSQFKTLLRRNVPIELSGECLLMIEVLVYAWLDAEYDGAVTTHRLAAIDARRFFIDGRCHSVSEVIGLDGAFVQDMFLKHHSQAELGELESWLFSTPRQEIAA